MSDQDLSESAKIQTHVVSYDHSAIAHDHPGKVAELHLESTAVAQVSELPKKPWRKQDKRSERDGFLIRVWQPHGVHQYGGNNLTLLSVVVEEDPYGQWRVSSLNIDEQWVL